MPGPAIAGRSIASAAFVAALAPAIAVASPLEDMSQTGAVFTGPATPYAANIFHNPAALGWAGQGVRFYLVGAVRLDQLSVDRYALDPDGGPPGDGPSASPLTATPTGLIAVETQAGEKVHIGLALHTPFADRFPTGDGLAYHTLGGSMYTALLSGAFSWQVDRFIFGAGFSFSYNRMRLEILRDTALDQGSAGVDGDCGGERCGLEHPDAAEHLTLEGDDYDPDSILGDLISIDNLGLSAGIAMEIPNFPRWWLTLSYIGPPGVDVGPTDAVEVEGAAAVRPAPRDGGATLRGEAEMRYRMPQTVWLAGKGPFMPGWTMIASLRWQDMSRQRELDLRLRGGDLDGEVPEWQPRSRGMRDTFQGQLGLEMDEGTRWRMGGRIRIERGATTPYTTSPLVMDTHNLALAVGGELRIGQHLVLSAGYDITAFLPVDTTSSAFDPRAQIACVDSGYDYENQEYGGCEAVRDGRALPSAAGQYGRLRHQVALGLRWNSL